MSVAKKKIGLIATEVSFSFFSVIYKVKPESGNDISGMVFCSNDIKNKDLILNPTYIDKENNEVIFETSNATPAFYQKILELSIKNSSEYKSDLEYIYLPKEIVGYIIV